MYKFTLKNKDVVVAIVDVAENLMDSEVTGSASTVVEQYLTQNQPMWVGDVDNGEDLVVAKPSSDPALMQIMLLQLPALLSRHFGDVNIDGDWSVFTKER